jgi:hypothetical protein
VREGRLRRAALTGVAACLALGTVVPVALAGQVNEAGDPPGQLVEVEGRNIHVLCTGAGSPGVILEAGASSFAIDWTLVQREVERSTMARPVRARLFVDYRQIQLREPNARGHASSRGGLVLKPARSLPRCNPRVLRGQAERCTLRAHDRGDALAPWPHSDLTRLPALVTCAPTRSGKGR